LEDRFKLTGWIDPQQVLDWFERSDILFMPSLSEGLPVVGVQALSKGLVIVASRVGGFVDLVDHGVNGYLIEADDAGEFVRYLRELLLDHERLLAFRRSGLKKATVFDINRVADEYEKVFAEVTKMGY
jgi:glycosyltransferase involved in cell wall biosynthesis